MAPLNFDSLPQAVSDLTGKVDTILELLLKQKNKNTEAQQEDKWFSLNELCKYLPGHPAKSTIYRKTSNRSIPHKRVGGRLIFLKSEIDLWLQSHARKTVDELENEAELKLSKNQNRMSKRTFSKS